MYHFYDAYHSGPRGCQAIDTKIAVSSDSAGEFRCGNGQIFDEFFSYFLRCKHNETE